MERCLVIMNPHSGGGRTGKRIRRLLESLPREGQSIEVAEMKSPGHAALIAEQSAGSYDTLVAVGGDGTVGEVATGILKAERPDTCLAILPAGTGNDAARGLGLHDWDTAVSALQSSCSRSIDVFRVLHAAENQTRERVALVGAGVGFPAEVVRTASKTIKRFLGRWAYLFAVLQCARKFRCPEMRVSADDQNYEGRFYLCAVANMERTAGQSMRMAPDARYDDGLLNVILLRESSPLRLLAQLPRLAKGTHTQLPEVEYFPARSLSVACSPETSLMIDGDLAGGTPVSFQILARGLRVKVRR